MRSYRWPVDAGRQRISSSTPEAKPRVPAGTTGELRVRGPYSIRSYPGEPERNREAFTPLTPRSTGAWVRHYLYRGVKTHDESRCPSGGTSEAAETSQAHFGL
jgi:non-ribosomal peptide synthetase component E (peptide arylation enzyme)